jgi:predicted DNA binding CopG/RHH family protein
MKWPKLTREEKAIEKAIESGDYVDVSPEEFKRIAEGIKRFRKNAILHIRINEDDLKRLKNKARKMGVKYQTFVAEILHRAAR